MSQLWSINAELLSCSSLIAQQSCGIIFILDQFFKDCRHLSKNLSCIAMQLGTFPELWKQKPVNLSVRYIFILWYNIYEWLVNWYEQRRAWAFYFHSHLKIYAKLKTGKHLMLRLKCFENMKAWTVTLN